MTDFDFNSMSEKEKIQYVVDWPPRIKFFDNPSKEVQLAAVNKNGIAIDWIENPSEEIQLAAIKNNISSINFIENPSEEVQLAAVNNNGVAIKFMENPSEKVQLAAVKNNWNKWFYEKYIKDLPNKTDWFYREFNRLKLIKGPLK